MVDKNRKDKKINHGKVINDVDITNQRIPLTKVCPTNHSKPRNTSSVIEIYHATSYATWHGAG
jgi:hypothetical protein